MPNADPMDTREAWLQSLEPKQQPTSNGTLTTSELLASAASTSWVVDGLLAAGAAVLLGADAGTGKTSLGYAAAAAVASGQPFLDQLPVAQGPALVIQADESPRDAARKQRLMGIDPNLPIRWIFPCLDPAWAGFSIPWLEARIREIQPRLLLLDSVTSLFTGGVATLRDAEFGQAFYALNDLASKHGCAVLVTCHLRKTETGQRSRVHLVDIAGTFSQGAGVADVIGLWSPPSPQYPGHTIIGHLGKRNLTAGTLWHLRGDTESLSWELVGVGDGDQTPRDRRQLTDRILEHLSTTGPQTPPQIAAQLAANVEHSRRICRDAFSEGKLIRIKLPSTGGRRSFAYAIAPHT